MKLLKKYGGVTVFVTTAVVMSLALCLGSLLAAMFTNDIRQRFDRWDDTYSWTASPPRGQSALGQVRTSAVYKEER